MFNFKSVSIEINAIQKYIIEVYKSSSTKGYSYQMISLSEFKENASPKS